jgi:hypothetical protein
MNSTLRIHARAERVGTKLRERRWRRSGAHTIICVGSLVRSLSITDVSDQSSVFF